MVRKWKSDQESVSRTRSPPKVNQFFRLVGPIITRVYFRPLKKGVVLPLAIVKKGVELPLEHIKKGVATP